VVGAWGLPFWVWWAAARGITAAAAPGWGRAAAVPADMWRARGGAVGRWGWCGPTCRRGGSAGRTAKGQNHGVERCPYAFFRGREKFVSLN
jgi:hypothetical protein